jgi:hypothetical protein
VQAKLLCGAVANSVVILLHSVRVFHFGFRTSKLGQNFEAPSPTTMLQGVCADPPSLYLWAFGVLTGCLPTYFRTHRCDGLHVKKSPDTCAPPGVVAP